MEGVQGDGEGWDMSRTAQVQRAAAHVRSQRRVAGTGESTAHTCIDMSCDEKNEKRRDDAH